MINHVKLPKNTIEDQNAQEYQYLIFFSMLYMSIMLCNAILTNRFISLGKDHFVLGGSFTSPLTFILSDIVAELFGYRVAKRMIWYGFVCQTLFAMICELVIYAPHPTFWQNASAYLLIFSPILYINFSSFVAFIISGLINVRILTRWKVLLQGRYFWLRSFGSSTFAEAIYSAIAIFMMEMHSVPMDNMWKLIGTSYLIKISYSIIFAAPSNILVNFIKKSAKIDAYDQKISYNPFKEQSRV